MPLNYTPLTEEQAKKKNSIEEGKYRFKVFSVEEKTDKNGDQYLKLQLEIYSNNFTFKVFDNVWLNGKMAFTLRNFSKSIRKLSDYEKNMLSMLDINNGQGYVNLVFGEPKADGRKFLEVGEYLDGEGMTYAPLKSINAHEEHELLKNVSDIPQQLDDDIPF